MEHDSGDRTAPEIEITPKMIEAGTDELSGFYLELEGGLDRFPEIVGNLYRRMEIERRKRPVT